MTQEQLTAYYDKNNVQPFHGYKTLDALKHLSELATLPDEIREDYYNQYATCLKGMGTSHNRKIGELIYKKFIGENPIAMGTVIDTYTFDKITFRAVEVNITHFERVIEYLREKGIDTQQRQTKYVVLDIVVDGLSTLQQLLDRSSNKNHRFCVCYELTFLCNELERELTDRYHKPYNGIDAERIVGIFREMVEKRRESEYTVRSYVRHILKDTFYPAQLDQMLEAIK